MKFYGFAYLLLGFFYCCSGCYASGQVRNVGSVVILCFLDDYCVAHGLISCRLQSSLFQYAVQCSRRQIVVRLTWYGYTSSLGWMLILTVATLGYHEISALLIKHLQHI